MGNRAWVVYLIRCSDNSLYCGITNNLQKRLTEHDSGKGAKYTRSRRPVELVAAISKMSKSDALKFEYRVKQLPSGKKIIELIKRKEEATMDIKKELNKVSKEMQAITKKIEKLIVAADKPAKASKPGKKAAAKKPAVKKRVKTKAVKKASAKNAAAKKVAAEKPAAEKPDGLTAAAAVLGAIEKSGDCIDVAMLMKETGFNQKKINNLIYKLKKQGKIKSEKRGVFAMA